MDREEKLEMLQKLSEKELTKKLLIPLFESEGMGCKSVRYTHRRLEFGKDIIYYKEDEYGNRIYTGVQVKKTTVTTKKIDNVLRQTNEAFGEQFTDLSDGKKKDLDRFVVLTSNEFLEEANESFRASLRGANLDRLVTCIDGHQLVRLLEKHMPSAFWKEYEYFRKYFGAMKRDFTTIEDISAIGRKELISLEQIYVSLRLSSEIGEQEFAEDEEEEWRIFEEEGEDETEEKEEQLSRVVAEVIDADSAVRIYDRLVIVGAPGSGKTTLLKYLAVRECKKNLDREERTCVPIPIKLRELGDNGKSLRAHVDKVFEKYEFPKAKKIVQKDLKEGRCRLLLDGFDELATKESQKKIAGKIERFAKKYPKSKIVVTSRPAGYHEELRGFRKVEVMPFDDKQIQRFVENWFGKSDPVRATSVYAAIKENERIKVLARNPLIITIIAIIYEEDRKLPQRRVDLYERCVEVLLSRWDVQKRMRNRYSSEKKRFILRKLAFYAHTNNKRVMREKELINEMLKYFPQVRLKESDSKPFLDEIWLRSYLIRQISMNRYDFLHLSFQEYFTALELKEREDGISRIIEHMDDPWWEEPILLYAGISRDASTLIKTIEKKVPEDMFCSNLVLFGKCVADAEFTDASLRERIVNELLALYRSSEFRILRGRAIGVLRSIKPDEIIGQLIRDLKGGEGTETHDRCWAGVALGLMGSEKAVEALMEALVNDDEVDVRCRAASALGHIGSEKAVGALLEALVNDDEVDVRCRAASALGRIGSEKTIERLMEVSAKGDNTRVRRRAESALIRIGGEKAIELLLETLAKDDKVDVRKRAASAFGSIGSDKGVEALLEALAKDDKAIVRAAAASALGRIGSEKTVEPLIDALVKGDKANVRAMAASALGRIGTEKAVEPLMNALVKDDRADVRAMAACALGRIGSEKPVGALLEALAKDDKDEVRGSAASALGRIGGETMVDPLLKALVKDNKAIVRAMAASALGRIRSEKAIKALMEALAKDDKAEVRKRAGYAIGRIRSEKAVEALLEALAKDDKAEVRAMVASALGHISGEEAIKVLLKALSTDEDSFVRGRAAESLGRIGGEKTVEHLKKALEDGGEYYFGKVKDAAFGAVEKISRRLGKRLMM